MCRERKQTSGSAEQTGSGGRFGKQTASGGGDRRLRRGWRGGGGGGSGAAAVRGRLAVAVDVDVYDWQWWFNLLAMGVKLTSGGELIN